MRPAPGVLPHPATSASPRRPLRSRETAWARALARGLTRWGVRPNHISVSSLGFAALASACLLLAPAGSPARRIACLVTAAVAIQLRLLANLLDGMVAIEGRLRTPTGALYNEVPDRLADVLILVGAGYAMPGTVWAAALGWAAAVTAVLTAYVRALGGAQGVAPPFDGPMGKPQRMALMTAACLLAGAEVGLGWAPRALMLALAVVTVGAVVTVARRLRAIATALD